MPDAGNDQSALTGAQHEIIAEARSQIAAGDEPNAEALRSRLRAAGGDDAALAQLDRVLSIHRARARLARQPAAAPAPKPSLRAALKTKPTVNANMDVRREGAATLVWDANAKVTGWDVRFSERADARADYAVIAEQTLPPETTRVELPLSDRALRVHLLGRARDGRLLRRAVISGLTRDSWGERWQRRASAS